MEGGEEQCHDAILGELVVFGSGGGSRWDWFCGGKKVGELCGSFHIAQVSLQLI